MTFQCSGNPEPASGRCCFRYASEIKRGRLHIGIELNNLRILPGDIMKHAGELVYKSQQRDEVTHHENFTRLQCW